MCGVVTSGTSQGFRGLVSADERELVSFQPLSLQVPSRCSPPPPPFPWERFVPGGLRGLGQRAPRPGHSAGCPVRLLPPRPCRRPAGPTGPAGPEPEPRRALTSGHPLPQQAPGARPPTSGVSPVPHVSARIRSLTGGWRCGWLVVFPLINRGLLNRRGSLQLPFPGPWVPCWPCRKDRVRRKESLPECGGRVPMPV